MEQAERFFRYIVPGLTMIIEFFAYVCISQLLLLFFPFSRDVSFSYFIGRMTNTGIAALAFLASGGIGFLLGVAHYTIVWSEWATKGKLKIGADLWNFLQQAELQGWLKLGCGNNDVGTTKLTKRGAWRVVTSYLSTRAETSPRIKGAIPRMERLANLVNGLGTTWVGSVFALLFFMIYLDSWIFLKKFGFSSYYLLFLALTLVIPLVMPFIHYRNFKGVTEDYESFVGAILLNEFEYEFNDNEPHTAIKLHVFKNDLNKNY